MKFILVAVLIISAVYVVQSLPTDEFEDIAELKIWEADQGVRQRRVTCDLMSYGGKVGHSACAANCLSMGKAGGRCNDGVCQCRKTTFKDLWNKRFG